MIELPGIGALVLDAMTSGRWREAMEIAAEDRARVHIDPPPGTVKLWVLLVTVWDDYAEDVDRKEHEGKCDVCGDWVHVEQRRDFEGDVVYELGWHGGGFACEGVHTENYSESRSRSRVPIAHGLEPVTWPYVTTGFGLEDLTRMHVAGNLENPENTNGIDVHGDRCDVVRLLVERVGVPRSFQVHDQTGKRLFQGVIGRQRTIVPGDIVGLHIQARYK